MDLMASAVAFEERLNMPVMPEVEARAARTSSRVFHGAGATLPHVQCSDAERKRSNIYRNDRS